MKKSQLLQPGYQKAFVLSVTRGRVTERRASVHCTHTDQTGSYWSLSFLDRKSSEEIEEVFGENC